MRSPHPGWTVVVPVKRYAVAKSRLLVPPPMRIELASAMVRDTVRAARRCSVVQRLVVVTDDERAASELSAIGAEVIGDEPDAGLNSALAHGMRAAREQRHVPVVLLSGDLPALAGTDLDAVLEATTSVSVVADRAGTGTTVVAIAAGHAFSPSYGEGSLARHVAAGAVDLTPTAPLGLRLDVDTLEDLEAARQLGVGPATAAALCS